MKSGFVFGVAAALLATPCLAQDWGSDYNMGTIGVLGGTEAGGTISIQCADAGNGVVPKGALSVFLNPAAGNPIGATSPGTLRFEVDGTAVVLPVSDNQGDGFVFDKTSQTLSAATQLIDLLETGQQLVVSADTSEIARIGLAGAGEALDGVEACLMP